MNFGYLDEWGGAYCGDLFGWKGIKNEREKNNIINPS